MDSTSRSKDHITVGEAGQFISDTVKEAVSSTLKEQAPIIAKSIVEDASFRESVGHYIDMKIDKAIERKK